MPASVVSATQRFRMEADPIRGFIEERIAFHHEYEGVFTARSEIYAAYTTWSILNGFHQMSAQRFYESFLAASTDINKQSLKIKMRNGIRGFGNVAIRN